MHEVFRVKGSSQQQPQDTKTRWRLVYKGPIIALGVVLYFMYILTVGEKMFSSSGGKEEEILQKNSITIFVFASFISQIVFFFLSGFRMEVLSSPISESFISVRSLSGAIFSGVSEKEAWPTLLFCLFLSSFCTGLVFFLAYFLRAEKVIDRIPQEISSALFVVLGILCVRFANERTHLIHLDGVSLIFISLVFNGLGVALCFLFLYLEKKCPSVAQYNILIIAGVGGCLFYGAVLWKSMSLDSLLLKGWLETDPRKEVSFSFPLFSFSDVNVNAVRGSIFHIAAIVFVNVLQFPINYPPTVQKTEADTCVRKELLTHAVSNVATSFVGTSSYILPSSTIAVRGAGSRNKIDTLFIALCMGGLFFLGYRYFLYVPFALFDLLLLFLGYNIVIRTLIPEVQKKKKSLGLIFAVSLISFVMNSVAWGAVAAVGVYAGVRWVGLVEWVRG